MKHWRLERGSVDMVEGSILFPLTFIAILLLLLWALFLYRDAAREAQMWRLMTQPTSGLFYETPEEDPISERLEQVKLTQHGLFFRTLHATSHVERKAGMPFRFFNRLKAISFGMERETVWSSPVENLWHFETINGFSRSHLGETSHNP